MIVLSYAVARQHINTCDDIITALQLFKLKVF